MLIKSIYIKNFGKFHDKTFQFEEGLNVIYGLNEAGKTTLHQFVEGMLYGFFKTNIKTKKYLEVYDKYLPWNPINGYEGILVIQIADKVYRIERNFLKKHDEVKVYNEHTGEEITQQIAYNPIIKLPDIGSFIDMTLTTFKNTISIGQLKAQTESELAAELKDYMSNLSNTKDQDISVENVVKRLQNALDKVGTEKKSKSPLGMVTLKIEELQEELERTSQAIELIVEKRNQCLEIKHQETLMGKEKEGLEESLKRIEQAKVVKRFTKAQEINKELQAITLEIEKRKDYKDIQMSAIEESLKVQEQINILKSQEEDLLIEKKRLEGLIEANENQIQELRIPTQDETLLEQLDKVFFDYESLKEINYKQSQLRSERETILKDIERIEEQIDESIEEKFLQYEHLEDGKRSCYDIYNELSNVEDQENKTMLQKRQWSYYSGSAIFVLISVFLYLVLPNPLRIIGTIVGCGIGFIGFALAFNMNKTIKSLHKKVQERLEEKQGIQVEIDRIKLEQQRILNEYKLSDGSSFKFLKEKLNQNKSKLYELQRIVSEKEKEWDYIDTKKKHLEKKLLEAIQLFEPEKNLIEEESIEYIKFAIRKVRQLIKEQEYLMEQLNRIESKNKGVANTLKETNRILEAIITNFPTEEKEIHKIKRGKEEWNRLQEAYQNREALLQEILDKDSLEALEVRCKGVDFPEENLVEDEEELKRELKELQNKQVILTKELSALETRLSELEGSYRPIGQIEIELKDHINEKERLTKKIKSIQLAIETLTKIANDIHSDFAPKLNEITNHIIGTITKGKYTKVRINHAMEMLVEDREQQKLIPIEQLSNGTIDQMYFAMRLGILDLIKGNQHYPIILDDTFIQYDDERLKEVLTWLCQQKERQILLFTCQIREKNTLDKGNKPYHFFAL